MPGRHKMGKHFDWEVHDGRLRHQRNAERVEAEARLDEIYVLRTSEPAARLSATTVLRRTRPQPPSTSSESRSSERQESVNSPGYPFGSRNQWRRRSNG